MGERNITHNLWWLVYPLNDCDEQHALIYLKNTYVFEIMSPNYLLKNYDFWHIYHTENA
jgi:hypothetical protein